LIHCAGKTYVVRIAQSQHVERTSTGFLNGVVGRIVIDHYNFPPVERHERLQAGADAAAGVVSHYDNGAENHPGNGL
jgi:hypothetical protein